MNREDIVISLMEKNPKDFKSHAAAVRAVNGVFNTIRDAVAAGDTVNVVGFGTFAARDRAARVARNPKTGETIAVPAKRAPGFKAGKAFKEAVQG